MSATKTTALSALATPAGEDLLYIVDDPGGTPASKKITLAGLLAAPILKENHGTNWNTYFLGAGLFKTVRILTDAQVKALPTTPVILVPAPGAGKYLVPIAVFGALSKPTSEGYDNVDAGVDLFFRNTDESISYFFPGTNGDGFFGSDNTGSAFFSPAFMHSNLDTYISSLIEDFENCPIEVQVENAAAGNFTAGNAANTFRFEVTWQVVET